jgi:serine/threonine-protein kinase
MVQEVSTEKICPKCGETFDKNQTVCPSDGLMLVRPNHPILGTVEPTALIGERIGPYEVFSLRNTGSKCFIFEVKHDSGKRMVMKMLRPELSQNKSSYERFQQEARLASGMVHPGIAAAYDIGVVPSGQPYLVMELVDGVTLAKVLGEKGKLDIKSFTSVFQQLCSVLEAAHKRGVIHRDLKPEHVMLSGQDDGTPSVKLLDFGCSKDLERQQKLTVPGLIIGNADYISPEQCSGGAIDARSDVYSLACIMYYALTGKKPFEGNIVAVMQKHLSELPPGTKQANPEVCVPEALESAIFKAMNKDPEERQQSTGELWADVEKAMSQTEGSSQPVSEEKPIKQGFLGGLVKHFKKPH